MLQPSLNSHRIFYLQDVSVTYGNIQALRSVQLEIERGEILFVTGASGAGKTTLMRILSGDLNPCSGRVVLPRILFVAQISQELRLIGRRTCEENLFMAYDPAHYGPKSNFVQDLMELSKIFGIDDRLGLKVCDANGGLKQKIAIICALLSRPDVLVADEPTSSLDCDNAKKVFDVFNLYNVKRGLSVIWASHNRELVKSFTGRIVHLDRGRLIHSGHACFI